jgi:GTPase SAR1 family protein
VEGKRMSFLVWDLGGKSSFRKLWEHYYSECHGVVYLFDERIVEGFECLSRSFL